MKHPHWWYANGILLLLMIQVGCAIQILHEDGMSIIGLTFGVCLFFSIAVDLFVALSEELKEKPRALPEPPEEVTDE